MKDSPQLQFTADFESGLTGSRYSDFTFKQQHCEGCLAFVANLVTMNFIPYYLNLSKARILQLIQKCLSQTAKHLFLQLLKNHFSDV
eukprot:bmy_15088T0